MKEDKVLKYGEFVCSEFLWLPGEKQKEKAEQMNEMTQSLEE